VDLWSVEMVGVLGVAVADEEVIEDEMDVLHVGDVTASADYGMSTNLEETIDIVVAGEGAVGCNVIGSYDYSTIEFDGYYTGTGDYGSLCMRSWFSGVQVGRVVGSIDVVSGTTPAMRKVIHD